MRAEVIAGLKWTGGAKLGGQLITWAITLVVMHLLSPSDYGLLAMATVFIAFLLMMSEAGLGPAIVQKEELDRSQVGRAFAIILAVNLVLLAAANALAPVIATFFSEARLVPILRALSLQFVIMTVTVIPEAVLTRQLRFRTMSLIDLVSTLVASVATLIMAWARFGVWALVLGSLLSRLARAVALNIAAPLWVRPRLSLAGTRQLLHFGGNITAARMMSFFFNQADIVIVGRVLGHDMLGLYSVAMQLASMPVQRISAILNQVTFPVVSRFQADRARVADFVVRAARGLSLIAFPVLWGISCTAREVVEAVLGSRWQGAAIPLQVLALMMPIRLVVNFLPSTTDALGRPELSLQNVLLAALIMPPAFLVGSRWGVEGVAYAWLCVFPFVLLFNTRRMLRCIGLRVRDFVVAIGPSSACAGAMYVIVRIAAALIGDRVGSTEKLAWLVATGVVAYVGTTLTFNRRGYRDVVDALRVGR